MVLGPAAVTEAIAEHRDYVCAETLALRLDLTGPPDLAVAEVLVEGATVRLGLEAVAPPACP